jgi:hypothetical protein
MKMISWWFQLPCDRLLTCWMLSSYSLISLTDSRALLLTTLEMLPWSPLGTLRFLVLLADALMFQLVILIDNFDRNLYTMSLECGRVINSSWYLWYVLFTKMAKCTVYPCIWSALPSVLLLDPAIWLITSRITCTRLGTLSAICKPSTILINQSSTPYPRWSLPLNR